MSARMRAAVLHGREDVRVEDVDVPEIGAGEILLRTRVALTCGTDLKVYRRGYHARMIQPPAVFGHEVAGVVERVGAGVAIEPGTPVVAANSAPCGECSYCRSGSASLCDDLLFWNGAYAEFVRIPARVVSRNLLTIEKGVGFREAAMVEPLACVLRGIEESGVAAGQTVAVIGAGAIGLMLVRLAGARGARVIAVGRNPRRLQKARELGAEETISVGPGEDLADKLRSKGAQGHGPDIVIEAVGLPETAEAAVRAVRKGGLVNLFAGCPADTRISIDAQRLHYQQLTIRSTFHHTPESIRGAYRLIADGLVDPRAFITGEASLEELPAVLERMARGGDDLKTAIVTADRRS
jgi:L-iditol 2-dehydrogenase